MRFGGNFKEGIKRVRSVVNKSDITSGMKVSSVCPCMDGSFLGVYVMDDLNSYHRATTVKHFSKDGMGLQLLNLDIAASCAFVDELGRIIMGSEDGLMCFDLRCYTGPLRVWPSVTAVECRVSKRQKMVEQLMYSGDLAIETVCEGSYDHGFVFEGLNLGYLMMKNVEIRRIFESDEDVGVTVAVGPEHFLLRSGRNRLTIMQCRGEIFDFLLRYWVYEPGRNVGLYRGVFEGLLKGCDSALGQWSNGWRSALELMGLCRRLKEVDLERELISSFWCFVTPENVQDIIQEARGYPEVLRGVHGLMEGWARREFVSPDVRVGVSTDDSFDGCGMSWFSEDSSVTKRGVIFGESRGMKLCDVALIKNRYLLADEGINMLVLDCGVGTLYHLTSDGRCLGLDCMTRSWLERALGVQGGVFSNPTAVGVVSDFAMVADQGGTLLRSVVLYERGGLIENFPFVDFHFDGIMSIVGCEKWLGFFVLDKVGVYWVPLRNQLGPDVVLKFRYEPYAGVYWNGRASMMCLSEYNQRLYLCDAKSSLLLELALDVEFDGLKDYSVKGVADSVLHTGFKNCKHVTEVSTGLLCVVGEYMGKQSMWLLDLESGVYRTFDAWAGCLGLGLKSVRGTGNGNFLLVNSAGLCYRSGPVGPSFGKGFDARISGDLTKMYDLKFGTDVVFVGNAGLKEEVGHVSCHWKVMEETSEYFRSLRRFESKRCGEVGLKDGSGVIQGVVGDMCLFSDYVGFIYSNRMPDLKKRGGCDWRVCVLGLMKMAVDYSEDEDMRVAPMFCDMKMDFDYLCTYGPRRLFFLCILLMDDDINVSTVGCWISAALQVSYWPDFLGDYIRRRWGDVFDSLRSKEEFAQLLRSAVSDKGFAALMLGVGQLGLLEGSHDVVVDSSGSIRSEK